MKKHRACLLFFFHQHCKSARFTARITLKGLSSVLTIDLGYTPYKLCDLVFLYVGLHVFLKMCT